MKQTAVEWLFEKLDVVDSSIMFVYFEQAKEMEKQQQGYSEENMKQAFKSGRMVKNYKAEWEETYSDEMTSCKYEDFKQWFEQFKKK